MKKAVEFCFTTIIAHLNTCTLIGIQLLNRYYNNEFFAERELRKKAEKIDVGEFLTSINLSKYREMFERVKVSGDVLLEGNKKYFHKLGVESAVDYVRIGALLRRTLTGAKSKNPMADLHLFLEQKGFIKYAETFEQHQIDGEMLLHLDKGLFMDVLEEVGVTTIDAMTIYTKFTYQ